jgi:hypothetical protein
LRRGASTLTFFFAVHSPRVTEPPRDLGEVTGPAVGAESNVGSEYDWVWRAR